MGSENFHLATGVLIIDSGRNQQRMLQLLVKGRRKRAIYLAPESLLSEQSLIIT